MCLKRDQRRYSYRRPLPSFPAGNTRRAIGSLSVADLFSSNVCRSSRRRRKSRYVICSMTSSGLEMPPDQNAFHIWSIWLLIAPVIMRTGSLFDLGSGQSQPGAFLEELDVAVVTEAAVPGLAGDLGQDLQVHETPDDLVRAGKRGAEQLAHGGHTHDGLLVEVVEHPMAVAGGAAHAGGDGATMLFAQLEDSSCGGRRLHAHFRHAAQEECEPRLEVSAVPDSLKPVVVLGAVTL